ncbi:hypothetical protein BT96DRAFT_992234 [Gymnopus androsaceus JB14]|uniref:Uncharacterized protein n=1 Tax=Gymnopus androsaceus JB14 TaxID=1447944 RepID=A0A6A4HT71_9AGAR|nr:hypothetical protein BT96DRAFT_992234 [Gymnopus androsaceus JB14]
MSPEEYAIRYPIHFRQSLTQEKNIAEITTSVFLAYLSCGCQDDYAEARMRSTESLTAEYLLKQGLVDIDDPKIVVRTTSAKKVGSQHAVSIEIQCLDKIVAFVQASIWINGALFYLHYSLRLGRHHSQRKNSLHDGDFDDIRRDDRQPFIQPFVQCANHENFGSVREKFGLDPTKLLWTVL